MKYEWNPEKNEWLKQKRGVSFEQIIFHLSQGDVWMIAEHPNQQKYPGQRIYFVLVEGYVYLVPHVIEEDSIFFKNHHSESKGDQGLPQRTGGHNMTYDREEQEILTVYERGEMTVSPPSRHEIEAMKAAASQTFKRDKRITVHLYDHDFRGIQKKALQMGIPYHTLIAGIIHRYVEGDLVAKGSS